MPGSQPGLTPPPEVPDEFASAYREAYQRALLDQSDGPRHRRPPQYRSGFPLPADHPVEAVAAQPPGEPPVDAVATEPSEGRPLGVDLPERRGRLVVGTHRQDAGSLDGGETWFDQVRDSRLFVPLLLVALALLLVLGAYVLGRVFTAAVGGG